MSIPITPRYSVCVLAGGKWVELSAHTDRTEALEAAGVQRVTDPDAVLFDWTTGEQVSS